MSPIEQAKNEGTFAAIAMALRDGWSPTAAEWEALAQLPIGDGRLDNLAHAYLWYGELKTRHGIKPVAKRARMVAERFSLRETDVAYYIIHQKDHRVTTRATLICRTLSSYESSEKSDNSQDVLSRDPV